jgi:hypothetical protein
MAQLEIAYSKGETLSGYLVFTAIEREVRIMAAVAVGHLPKLAGLRVF